MTAQPARNWTLRTALLVTTSAGEGLRLHRPACKRVNEGLAPTLTLAGLDSYDRGYAKACSTCKPRTSLIEAARADLRSSELAEAEAAAYEEAADRLTAAAAAARATVEREGLDCCADTSRCHPGLCSTLDTPADGYVPATDRNLVAEKRARLDAPRRSSGRKTGDPRADRAPRATLTRDELAAEALPQAVLAPTVLAPVSATAHPEALEGHFLCHGACAQVLPVARFPFVGNKGDGKGRYLECGKCQTARLARNKAARAEGRELEPRPRAAGFAPAPRKAAKAPATDLSARLGELSSETLRAALS